MRFLFRASRFTCLLVVFVGHELPKRAATKLLFETRDRFFDVALLPRFGVLLLRRTFLIRGVVRVVDVDAQGASPLIQMDKNSPKLVRSQRSQQAVSAQFPRRL